MLAAGNLVALRTVTGMRRNSRGNLTASLVLMVWALARSLVQVPLQVHELARVQVQSTQVQALVQVLVLVLRVGEGRS